MSDHSSDEELMAEELDVEESTPAFDPKDLVVGTFVLVDYSTKKSSIFYAAQIEAVCGLEYELDCLRRVGESRRFVKPERKDPDTVDDQRIVKILTRSSEGIRGRAIGGYTLDIDIKNMCIR